MGQGRTDSERILLLEQDKENMNSRISDIHREVKGFDGKMRDAMKDERKAFLNEVRLIFIDESRKTSAGINKRIDKHEEQNQEKFKSVEENCRSNHKALSDRIDKPEKVANFLTNVWTFLIGIPVLGTALITIKEFVFR